jgi:hypothetical protein
MRKTFLLFSIIFLLPGCKKESGDIGPGSNSGKFSLSYVSNLKSTKAFETIDSANFVLDSIKSSRSFYFILSNVGQEDITDVTISTDNSNFNINPLSIRLLPGTKNQTNTALTQVVSLDIVHGTRINGVGYTNLLNMGDNYCNINLQGKTLNGSTDITIKTQARIKVFAKVMAISLYQGKQEYDLTNPDGKVIGSPFDVDQVNYYNYTSLDPPIFMKNTGNVAINLSLASFNPKNPLIQQSKLLPNDSVALNLSTLILNASSGGEISLDSNGTIFDQKKLNLGKDGNAYFALFYQPNTGPVTPPNDSIKHK